MNNKRWFLASIKIVLRLDFGTRSFNIGRVLIQTKSYKYIIQFEMRTNLMFYSVEQ